MLVLRKAKGAELPDWLLAQMVRTELLRAQGRVATFLFLPWIPVSSYQAYIDQRADPIALSMFSSCSTIWSVSASA